MRLLRPMFSLCSTLRRVVIVAGRKKLMPRTNKNTTTDVDVPTLTDVIVEQIAHDTDDAASTDGVVTSTLKQCQIIDEADGARAEHNQVAGGFRLRVVVSVSTMTETEKANFQSLVDSTCKPATSKWSARFTNPGNEGTIKLAELDFGEATTVDERLEYLPNIKGPDGKAIKSYGALANLIMPKSEASKIRAIARQVAIYNSMSTDKKAEVDAEIVRIDAKAMAKASVNQLQVALNPKTFSVTYDK